MRLLRLLLALFTLGLAALSAKEAEILWDAKGVPHIYAEDQRSLFAGYGFAQMHSHGNLVLKLYGESRGRSAEYWGKDYLENDRWVRLNEVPERAARWLEQQDPAFRRNLEAFATGINTYAERHPEALDPERRRVLPITAADVIGHFHRIVHFSYFITAAGAEAIGKGRAAPAVAALSNAMALAPARTGGGTLLLMNPHLPWRDWYTYYETHLVAPGINLYGASQIGFPVLRFCFSATHGFTQTVNNLDGADLYRLSPLGSGYLYDGVEKPWETRSTILKIRQPDGTFAEETLTTRSSLHGPVVYDKDGVTLALRVAALDRPHLIKQYWDMALAPDFTAYQTAVRQLQVPTFNITYADRAGNVMYLYNGTLPRRPAGKYDWANIVPGDTSATLWTAYHSYEELPKVINPPTGWVQNTNDPPWSSTWPSVLNPDDFPSYTAGRTHTFRTTRALRLLTKPGPLDRVGLERLQLDTHLEGADRLLPDLFAAAEAAPASSNSPEVAEAIALLRAWDRTVEPTSTGGVLYAAWINKLMGPTYNDRKNLAVAQTVADPFATPRGLADPNTALTMLADAARDVKKAYGRLDPPWGEVHRLRRGEVDLPARGASGGLGSFHVVDYGPPDKNGQRAATRGDTFVAVVEWSKAGELKADVRLSYGNSSQPGSPHATDQLADLAAGRFRPAKVDRAQIEPEVERRDRVRLP